MTVGLGTETCYVGSYLTLTCTHCWELMKSVGMIWYVANAIHIAVEGPWTCVWPMLLFKLLISSVLWSVFLDSLGWDSLFFMVADGFWFSGQIWNIQFLIIDSSPNYFQVPLNCKHWEVLNTCKVFFWMEGSLCFEKRKKVFCNVGYVELSSAFTWSGSLIPGFGLLQCDDADDNGKRS
jgi:hypothetical protein